MPAITRRRDTLGLAIGLAVAAVALWLVFGPAAHALPVAVAAGVIAGAVVIGFRRHLPADMPLAAVDPTDPEWAHAATPAPDRTALYVEYQRAGGGWERLDLFVDDRFVGQLVRGSATILSLRLGLREFSVRSGLSRTRTSEQINGIPGGVAGLTIRRQGGRRSRLEVTRLGPDATVAHRPGIRRLRPVAPA